MIHAEVFTPKGVEHTGDYNYIEVMDVKNGSFGILENHVPVISIVENGYVILKKDDDDVCITLLGAVVKFQNNSLSIISELIAIGKTPEESKKIFDDQVSKRRNENRERNVELAQAENELRKQIKKTGAGSL